MKYWGIAKKVQAFESNQDPEKFVVTFKLVFWSGFVFNAVAGLLYGVYIGIYWF